MISRGNAFYTADIKLPNVDASRYISTIVPDTASIRDVVDGQLIIFLNQDWANIPPGSLVSLSPADMSAARKVPIDTAMTPTKAQAIENVAATDNILCVKENGRERCGVRGG